MNAHSNVWRACLLVSALCAAAPSPGAGQSLTATQQKVYERHRISLEVNGVTLGSGNQYMATATTRLVWRAHEGFEPIMDSTFFARMGMPEQAVEAGRYYRTFRRDFKWGAILSGVGIVGMLATAGTAVNGNWTPFWISTAVSCGGIGFLVAALGHTGNRYPLSTVEDLPDPYNAQLRSRIVKGQMVSLAVPGEQVLVGLRVPIP